MKTLTLVLCTLVCISAISAEKPLEALANNQSVEDLRVRLSKKDLEGFASLATNQTIRRLKITGKFPDEAFVLLSTNRSWEALSLEIDFYAPPKNVLHLLRRKNIGDVSIAGGHGKFGKEGFAALSENSGLRRLSLLEDADPLSVRFMKDFLTSTKLESFSSFERLDYWGTYLLLRNPHLREAKILCRECQPFVGAAKSIQTLDIAVLALNIAEIAKNTSLTKLRVNSYAETGWKDVAGMQNIENLALTFSGWKPGPVDDFAEKLKENRNLKALSLRSANISSAGMKLLSQIPELKGLSLGSMVLDADGMAFVAEADLESLSVSWPYIKRFNTRQPCGDICFVPLEKMKNLKSLVFKNAELRAAGASVASGLKNLGYLDLSGNLLRDKSAEYLSKLEALKYLNLSKNPLTAKGIEDLSKLKELSELHLADIEIGDEAAAHIAEMTGLEVLDISRTKIGEAGLLKILTLPHLKELRVNKVPISVAVAEAMAEKETLEKLVFGSQNYSLPADEHDAKLISNAAVIALSKTKTIKTLVFGLDDPTPGLTGWLPTVWTYPSHGRG